jgi:large subunit GTPase 1
MPRNQGTSRKGKPNKHDRESGMGKSLIKLHANKYRPRSDGKNRHGDGGMTMTQGVTSIGIDPVMSGMIADTNTTKSVLELQELDDFLLTAELANQQFAVEHEGVVILDETARHYSHQQQANTPRVTFADNDNNLHQQSSSTVVPSFAFTELSVPRRPKWDSTTTPQQLEVNERESFLQWRRSIAQQEEKLFTLEQTTVTTGSINHRIAATPFEKNLQVWRQLWRVLERSDCVLQLVDGRNPLFYLSYDLKQYATEDLKKPMMILVNKSDYLSKEQRQLWYDYLTKELGWDPDSILFFSAITEQQVLDEAAYQERRKQANREQFDTADEIKLNMDEKDDEDETGDDGEYSNTSDSEDENEQRNRNKNKNVFGIETEEEDDENTTEEEKDNNNDNGKIELTNTSIGDSGCPNLHDDDVKITPEESTQQKTNTENSTQLVDQTNRIEVVDLSAVVDEKLDTYNSDEVQQPYDSIGIDRPLSRKQLLDTMMKFAQSRNCAPNPKYNRIQFGMVGFPNVGKSSVINVLVGSSKHTHGLVRVAVANQPGKTKHFQTLLLPDRTDMMLCDCPGLVFPSFVSNTADLIAAGVYPIAQMREHWTVMSLICQRIPRPIIESLYGIQLPSPAFDTTYSNYVIDTNSSEQSLPPPTPEEFLGTLCVARGMLAANSGVPDYQRAARMIVKDYASGKLLYCHPPPSTTDVAAFQKETIQTAIQNTQKLQEKLALRLQQQEKLIQRKTNTKMKSNGIKTDAHPTTAVESNPVVDGDILELLDGVNVSMDLVLRGVSKGTTKSNNNEDTFDKFGKKIKTPKSRWGKKNRKNRNPDPYGCHSTPDDSLISYNATTCTGTSTTTGLIVQGGKRYTTGGYTRPTSYPILE